MYDTVNYLCLIHHLGTRQVLTFHVPSFKLKLSRSTFQVNMHAAPYIIWIICILCTPRPIYRSIYRPTYRSSIGRYVDSVTLDRYVAYRLICRPRVVVRLSADMSIDRLLTFRRYFTATCILVTVDIIFAAQISLIYSPLFRGFFV